MRVLAAAAVAAFCACAAAQPNEARPQIRELDVPSEGFTLHVRSVGGAEGSPVLLLIHGGPGLSSDYLRGLEKLSGPKLRVVSYDQRGVGKSSRRPKKDGKID